MTARVGSTHPEGARNPDTARQWVECPQRHRLFRARGQGREIEIWCRQCRRLVLVPALTTDARYLEERIDRGALVVE